MGRRVLEMTAASDEFKEIIDKFLGAETEKQAVSCAFEFYQKYHDNEDMDCLAMGRIISDGRISLFPIQFVKWINNKGDNMRNIALANAFMFEKQYIAAFFIANHSFEIAKKEKELVTDSAYALITAAASLGLKENIVSILTYINDVNLEPNKVNERKSNWIFDLVENEGISIERDKFPNLR
jgi:hypothetical protein